MDRAALALCAPPRPRDAVVARSSVAFWLVVFEVTDQALSDLLTEAHTLSLGAAR